VSVPTTFRDIPDRVVNRSRRAERQGLIDRVIMLRTALEGAISDNAALRRQLASLRVENRALQAKLGQPSSDSDKRSPAEGWL